MVSRITIACLMSVVAVSTSACAANRSDFLNGTAEFGKALDSANTYTTKRLEDYRSAKRASVLDQRKDQLVYALVTGEHGEGVPWDKPVDAKTLLCNWQTNYYNGTESWAMVQSIRKPLSDLTEPSKEKGFSLLFQSLSANYTVSLPAAAPRLADEQKAKCEQDFDDADKSLGHSIQGRNEATGIPQLDIAVAVYKALDTFSGVLGSYIDDKKRAQALRTLLLDPKIQQGFNNNIDALSTMLNADAANQRLHAARLYVIAYLEYKTAQTNALDTKGLPDGKTARTLAIFNKVEKDLNPPVHDMLTTASAYDTALDMRDEDQYKALKDAFQELVAVAKDDKASIGKLVTEAKQLKALFDAGKTAYTDITSAVGGKDSGTPAAK